MVRRGAPTPLADALAGIAPSQARERQLFREHCTRSHRDRWWRLPQPHTHPQQPALPFHATATHGAATTPRSTTTGVASAAPSDAGAMSDASARRTSARGDHHCQLPTPPDFDDTAQAATAATTQRGAQDTSRGRPPTPLEEPEPSEERARRGAEDPGSTEAEPAHQNSSVGGIAVAPAARDQPRPGHHGCTADQAEPPAPPRPPSPPPTLPPTPLPTLPQTPTPRPAATCSPHPAPSDPTRHTEARARSTHS